MPGFPALGTTARARLCKKSDPIQSLQQSWLGLPGDVSGWICEGDECLIFMALSEVPDAASHCWGAPHKVHRVLLLVTAVLTPGGLHSLSLSSDRLFKQKTDRLWVFSFLWEFLSA